MLHLCNVNLNTKKMAAIIQSFTLYGYKIVHQIFNNHYVQLATQNLSVDFVLIAIVVETKKMIGK